MKSTRTYVASSAAFALLTWGGALSGVHAANTFTVVSGNDWNTADNWSDGIDHHVPLAGEEVIINGNVVMTNSPAALESYTLNSGKFHTFDGWDTVLTTKVAILTGTLTHTNNLATSTNSLGVWTPNARVQIVCSNLTVNSTGSINVNGKGYGGGKLNNTDGYGPGRGVGAGSAGGGGYGGVAGRAAGLYGQTYGDAAVPEQPGSGGGGGMTDSIPGGNGGGVVRIEASGAVNVLGTISANGLGRNRHYSGGGSGGSVYITCKILAGSGTVSANGETTGAQGGAGGGGRISILYNAAAQSVATVPTMRISASGAGDYVFSDLGTLYFSDNQLLLNQTGAVKFSGQWLPVLTKWERSTLTMDSAWIRFPADGFEMTVTNNLTIQGTQYYLHGLELSNGVLRCGGNVMLNASSLVLRKREDSGSAFYSGGNLMVSNSAALFVYGAVTDSVEDYGALVSITGQMVVAATSWIYPCSHPTNGGTPIFKVGSLTIPTEGSGFKANGYGYKGGGKITDGYGPGRGKGGTYGGGGGYGGFGGYVTASTHGQTNGLACAPMGPGSGGGGGSGTDWPGGNGGGAIRIVSKGDIVMNGSLIANGLGRTGHNSGSGSGGSIFVICKSFNGTGGIITANGENGPNSNLGGGGGGGRVAVWLKVPQSLWSRYLSGDLRGATINTNTPTFSGTVTAGIGQYSRTPLPTEGTIVFLTPPPQGTVFMIH